MRLFRRRRDEPTEYPFGPWLVRQLAKDQRPAEMNLAELELLCSTAASVMSGAAYAEPETARALFHESEEARADAALVAKRTGKAFHASLEDRMNSVSSWPWDDIGMRVAWRAQESGQADEDELGRRLMEVAGAYAAHHRDQLGAALELWERVAAGAQPEAAVEARPSLVTMGRQLLGAFQLVELAGRLP